MSKFQIIILTVFGFAILAGVIAFAVSGRGGGGTASAAKVSLWGTLPKGEMNTFLKAAEETYDDGINVSYVEKRPEVFERELVEALALGGGPDMILIPHDLLWRETNKIYPMPWNSLPERTFKDLFIEATEIFLSPGGVTLLPIGVDPLIMYWNRDLFSTVLMTEPPRTWDEFFSLAEKLTKKDAAGNIIQSAVALGEMSNIESSKEILSAFMLQAGTPIISYAYTTGKIGSELRQADKATGLVPAEEALRYFTEFANPSKFFYSWNRSLPNSLSAFLSGRLAVYFGFASESADIREKNPNLNFDVASLPQIKGTPIPVTFGKLYGIGVLKSSKNVTGAFAAANILTGSVLAPRWPEATSMAPVRRALLRTFPQDPFLTVAYKGAAMSRAWLDPNPIGSYTIFRSMVESVTSGRLRIREAVSRAHTDMFDLLK